MIGTHLLEHCKNFENGLSYSSAKLKIGRQLEILFKIYTFAILRSDHREILIQHVLKLVSLVFDIKFSPEIKLCVEL